MRKIVGRIGEGLAGVAVVVGGLLIPALMFGLFIGGISYRKECDKTGSGVITKEWTFAWTAPVPYVFRPDDPRCVIHSGTRVALAEIGIGEFKPTTPAMIAENIAPRLGNNSAYYVRARAVLGEYIRDVQKTETLTQGEAVVTKVRTRLARLDPPPRYASVHQRLLRLFARFNETADEFRRAVETGDQAEIERLASLAPTLESQGKDAITEFNRLRVTE